jgi:hypothetical protein
MYSRLPGGNGAGDRFAASKVVTDNEKDSIGSAHAEAPAGMPGKAGASTADRIH